MQQVQKEDCNEARFVRMKLVQTMTSLSRSHIVSQASTGKLLKSIFLVPGGTSRAWVYSEVQEWLDQRIAERDQEAGNE